MATSDWVVVGSMLFATIIIGGALDRVSKQLNSVIGLLNDIKWGRREL